ncbi:stage 0 sporulation family protein [Muribaculum intestinale]|uniref:PSP1 domain-containing protein n=1 Tax=Muribaculum intestinale TaxID=1796646 RepID=UPI0025A93414|nr:regulatory iron-sulfur-containing complex subunit RicT [Muribaculum intestinale]
MHPVSAHTPAPRRCDSCRKAPRGKLHCHNWLDDIPGGYADFDIVEVQFKNTRKGYYRNTTGLDIAKGDLVAVEASPGHDIGEITLTGRLVALQMKKAGLKRDAEIKRIFRKAKPSDIEKYEEAKARENDTMIKARKIAEDLNLNMKIGDVEYQGDGNKAIFYYIADERVDFRKLIKVLAETFRVRIEMKQIGARQEAGRIGGIGPCGRPLCCSTWMTNFVSVATSAARFQDISLNPQKLAGQCAKLKCCLNFEVDAYVESVRQMPSKDIRLETADNTYFHFKTDIFKREITYSTDKQMAANLVTIPAKRAFEVIALNKAGEKPLSLIPEGSEKPQPKKDFIDLVGQDSLTRFDKTKKKKKKKPQQPKDGNQQPRSKDGQQRPPKANDRKGGNSQPKDKGQQPKLQQPQDATQKPSRGDKGNDRRQQPNKQRQQPRQPKQPKQQPQQKPE